MRRTFALCAVAACVFAPVALATSQQQSAEPDTRTYVLRPVGVQPTPMHLTIMQMVANCLGTAYDAPVLWMLADSLVMAPSGTLAYGLYVRLVDGRHVVFIQREYWMHPLVISHELVHAAGRRGEANVDLERCMIRLDPPLPYRTTTPDHVASLDGRALRIDYGDDDAPYPME